MKYRPGDMFPATAMKAVSGEPINLPDPECVVHLQFRRFVDCPICNTHIAEFRKRAPQIEAAGIKEVIVFHSSPKSIRSYQKDFLQRFLVVGDPNKVFYKAFGVESSLSFISPLGLPADFLIARSGRIDAVKYGRHAYDQWSVDELLALAKGELAFPAR